MRDYANPDALMHTGWAKNNLEARNTRFVECSTDVRLYGLGHVPGAVCLDWETDLTDGQTRDIVNASDFERLMERCGVNNDTTVVLYGDQSNMMACFAYWVFKIHGHDNLRILDGGRAKWTTEKLPLVVETVRYPPGRFTSRGREREYRARREDVLEHIGKPGARTARVKVPAGRALVDDRSPEEFNGVVRERAGYPERYLRGGHIPGAVNLHWVDLVDPDGTFRRAEEIDRVLSAKKLTADQDVIVYTRIGERATLTWFVLHELMGFKRVRAYDGSWTEWGNLIGMPIESPTRLERRAREQRALA
jgi:thiosulfate/3-mercaptopyruvate sulfurtransferase